MRSTEGQAIWPPERIQVELPWDEAIVLYELVERYHEAGVAQLLTDRAEWNALVALAGHLERGGAAEIPNYGVVLEEARRRFDQYDGAPF